MAEIAILRHSDSGYRHGACDIAHYGLRPHQFTPTQPRAGLFAACRFSCILLELAICSDRNLAPTLLCLLLFYTSDKRFKPLNTESITQLVTLAAATGFV